LGLGAEAVRAIEKELKGFSRPRHSKRKQGPGKSRKSL
jgi:hypothetical protein